MQNQTPLSNAKSPVKHVQQSLIAIKQATLNQYRKDLFEEQKILAENVADAFVREIMNRWTCQLESIHETEKKQRYLHLIQHMFT